MSLALLPPLMLCLTAVTTAPVQSTSDKLGSNGFAASATDIEPTDLEIATWFERGEVDRAVRAVKRLAGQRLDAPLSPAAIGVLVEIASVELNTDRPPIAVYRIALEVMMAPAFDDLGVLQGRRGLMAVSASTMRLSFATALLDEGYAVEAEPHLRALTDPYIQDDTILPGGWVPAFRLGLALEALSRPDEAELLYRRLASGCAAAACEPMFADPLHRALVRVLILRGQAQAAVRYSEQLAERPISDDFNNFTLIDRLLMHARALVAAGDLVRAEAVLRRAIALAPAAVDRIDPGMTYPGENVRRQWADLLEQTARAVTAESIRRAQLNATVASPRNPPEGSAIRAATLALAENLARQSKAEAFEIYAALWLRTIAAYGAATPQTLDVAEPLVRALLRAGRAGDALAPARAALAARTSLRFVGDMGGANPTALASRRRAAARLMVEAVWKAKPPTPSHR